MTPRSSLTLIPLCFFLIGMTDCSEVETAPTGDTPVLTDGSEDSDEIAEVGPAECAPIAQLSCGSYVLGDTSDTNSGTTTVIDGYPIAVGNYSGPEVAWFFRAEVTGEVTWRLIDPTPTEADHDVLVLEGSTCAAEDAIARGFNSVTFDALAGQDYFLLIDGFAGAQGEFEAELECDEQGTGSPVEVTEDECAIADPSNPDMEPGDLYLCRDAQLNDGLGCGADGYAEAFGAKYAEIYMWEVYKDVSPTGQDFLDDNLVCLHNAFLVDTNPQMSCEEVAEAGFGAHPDCYLESGICDVPFLDKLVILGAVEYGDLFHWSQLEAFAQIATTCD